MSVSSQLTPELGPDQPHLSHRLGESVAVATPFGAPRDRLARREAQGAQGRAGEK